MGAWVFPQGWLGRLQQLLLLCGMCVAYLLAGHFALLVALREGQIAPYYPSAGIALTALLLFRRSGLLVVLIGEFMLQYTLSAPGGITLLFTAGEALGALAAWEFLTRRGEGVFQLQRSRDLGKLVVAGLLYGALAATTGLAGLQLGGEASTAPLTMRWCIWALGDALGILCIVPLVLSWGRPSRSRFALHRSVEALACGLLTLGTSLLTFIRAEGVAALRQPLAFPTFAIQVWAALRFGLRGASAASLAVSVIAVYGTALSRGPFADFPVIEQALVFQGYILLHALMGLMLSVLLYERERAEGELRRQREYLRQIVDISPDIIFVKDRLHRYVFVNQAMADVYGTTIQDLLGRTDWDFGNKPEYAQFYASVDDEVLATGQERFVSEEPLVDASGKLRWVQVVKRPLLDEFGIPRQVLGVATDITARLASQRELMEQRRYLRQIIDINPCLIFSKDRAGRFVLVNQTVADMYGVPVEQLLGKTDSDFNPNAQEVEFFRRMDQAVLESGEDLFIPEEVLSDSQGQRHWLQTIKRPIFNDAGEAVEVLGVATVITSRKLAEQERSQLELRVQEAQRLESMGILAGGVAHDFNNLLAAILGNADLALLDLGESDPAAASVRRIRTAALRASELANQMLAFSGKGSFVREMLGLNQLVEEMLDLLQAAIGPAAQIRRELDPALPEIQGDATQLRQVVMNLLTNAADALPAAGGVITFNTCCGADAGVPGVVLEVRDNGSGMDDATRARVFDPFFTTKFTGRGLGMAAVLGIVRGHHGSVAVESEPGRGTKVRVFLPLLGGPGPAAGRAEQGTVPIVPAADDSAAQAQRVILIVDDDPAICSVARRALARHGYGVLEAHDGARAVELFTEHWPRISAVLLDLTMPGMSGEEALQHMLELDPRCRVIVSSGYSEADVTAGLGQRGCAGFLQKPYEIRQLIDVFERLFNPPRSA